MNLSFKWALVVALVLFGASVVVADPGGSTTHHITMHPGDIFIRADELNSAGDVLSASVYKFDPPRDLLPGWTEGMWFSPGSEPLLGDISPSYVTFPAQTEGLSVDKFERVITVYSATGTALSEASLAIGQALHLEGGVLKTVTLPGGYKQITDPTDVWVPSPVNVKAWLKSNTVRGTGCGSYFYAPRTWPSSGYPAWSNHITPATDMRAVVGFKYWFLSADQQAQTGHGDWGPAPTACTKVLKLEDHKTVHYYIQGGDYDVIEAQPGWTPVVQTRFFPGTDGGPHQVGDNVVANVQTKAEGCYFSPCGDQCIRGSSGWEGTWDKHTIETRFLFSSAGQTVTTQRMYALIGVGAGAEPKCYNLGGATGTQWVASSIDPGKIINRAAGAPLSIGIAASDVNPAVDDYVYTSGLNPDFFAVSTRFWRNGGTLFSVRNDGGGNWYVDWEEDFPYFHASGATSSSYNKSGSVKLLSGITDDLEGIRAIAADGRGNLYFTHTEFDPADASDLETLVDPANPTASSYFVPSMGSSVTVQEPTKSVWTWEEDPGNPGQFRVKTQELNQHDRFQKEIVACQFPNFVVKEWNYITDGNRDSGTVDATPSGSEPARIRGRLVKGFINWQLYAYANQSGAGVTPVYEWLESAPQSVSSSAPTSAPYSENTVTNALAAATIDVNWPDGDQTYNMARQAEVTTITSASNDPFRITTVTVYRQRVVKEIPRGSAITPYAWDSPMLIQPGAVQFKSIDIDMATVNVTEPPLVQQEGSDPDIHLVLSDTATRVLYEDETRSFQVENGPNFAGSYTNPAFGFTNSACSPGVDTDVDGKQSYFSSSLSRDTLQYQWRIYALDPPLRYAYNQGAPAAFDKSNDGMIARLPWRLAKDFPPAGFLPDDFQGPYTMPGPAGLTFADPGRYVAVLDVRCMQWFTPPSMNYLSTPADIGTRWINETSTIRSNCPADFRTVGGRSVFNPGPGLLPSGVGAVGAAAEDNPEIFTVTEHFEVKPAPASETAYITQLALRAPVRVVEDQIFDAGLTGGDVNNVFASCEVHWFKAHEFQYDADQATVGGHSPDFGRVGSSGNTMAKFNGVGILLYDNWQTNPGFNLSDPSTWSLLSVEEREKRREGLSIHGTRSTTLTVKDWEAITYRWYVKIPDPENPGTYLGGDPGLEICSGNLRTLLDAELSSPDPNMENLTEKVPATEPAYYVLPMNEPITNRFEDRDFKVRIPLATAAFEKYKCLTPTYPTQMHFTCVVSYPKVEWADDATDTKDYLYLHQRANEDALYANGGTRVPSFTPGVSASHDYAPMQVYDTTLPSAAAFGIDAADVEGSAGAFPPTTLTLIDVEGAGSGTDPGPGNRSINVDVDCGKPVQRGWSIDLFDNNPYCHWQADGSGIDDHAWPQLASFFFEAGRDPRNHGRNPHSAAWTVSSGIDGADVGLGLNGPSSYNLQLGFDVAKTDSGSDVKYYRRATEGCGYEGAAPMTLTNGVTWKYPSSMIAPLLLDSGAYTAPGIDVFAAFSPAPIDAPSAAEAVSIATAAVDRWIVPDSSPMPDSALWNGRWTRWDLQSHVIVLPIFLETAAGEGLGQYGSARDRYFWDGSAVANAESPKEKLGAIGVSDTVAPSLKVEILDYKEGRPMVFFVGTDFSYQFPAPNSAEDLDFYKDYQRVYLSEDHRPVAELAGVGRDVVRIMRQNVSGDDTTEPSCQYVGGVHRINLPLMEDVPVVLNVWAVDNASQPIDFQEFSIKPVAGAATTGATAFPAVNFVASRNTVDGKAFITATHRYPRENVSDAVEITVRDGSGNERKLQIILTTQSHNLDFRVISDSVLKR